jgi:S-adenosylmethionine decarboxylase
VTTSGCEWIVEAHGCNPAALADLARMKRFFARLIEGMQLHLVAEAAWHQFPSTGGITGLCLLKESHVACHTFPEYNSLCLNVFCCRPRSVWEFQEELELEFGAASVQVRRIERPYHSS